MDAANITYADATKIPTFAYKEGTGTGATYTPPLSLTTPVSYLNTYVPDTFAEQKQITFGYVTGPAGFLLFSPGPDQLYSLEKNQAGEKIIYGADSLPSPYLIVGPASGNGINDPNGAAGAAPGSASDNAPSYTYDASNGTSSAGDVYRTK